ncbi:MAG: hypothetical protein RJB13_2355 [Pseudomonadota bacterium]
MSAFSTNGFRTSLVVALSVFIINGCGESPNTNNRDSKVHIVGGKAIQAHIDDERAFSTVALTTDHRSTLQRGSKTLFDSGKSFCTATIISDSALLTAAHCLADYDQRSLNKSGKLILPSSHDFIASFGNQVSGSEQWIRAKEVIPHPDWQPHLTLSSDPSSAPRDIGIVILERPIPKGYFPAKVGSHDLDVSEKQIVHLVGFGVTWSRRSNNTGVLREVEVPIKKVSQKSETIVVSTWLKGACAGDSGGPMYVRSNDGLWSVVGVTSAGVEILQTCVGLNNSFTDVRANRNWIRQVLQEHGQDLL